MADREKATELAEKIGATCTEALLDWGAAVREARKDPTDKLREVMAQRYGERAMALAVALAEKLRP